ncbi:amidohydrolase [Gallaecimonas xiamenensis]|uniref:Amidohydrolase 3 n=1 Tax=Gallaecimonas xiamenensis 3-C-1 TaxID=745411 RepID=K2JKL4_9GAMM|nr:amidohydrolase [Gallaecimonas xiamenensis]EKE71079.1 amidohydrolase 3 [Gallaecimonas xiamenensis 3-C-1]
MLRQLVATLALVSSTAAAQSVVLDDIKGYGWEGDKLVTFSRLVIDQGKVVARGGPELAIPEGAQVRDLEGKTVIPGLIDAHGHVMGLGQASLNVDLAGAKTLAEALARVSRFAKKHPDLPWIQGRGWNQELWPDKRLPSASDLALVADGRPVWLTRVDGHAGWANEAAMKKAGISAQTLAPEGGQIVKTRDGQPTGILIDNAMGLMTATLPSPNAAEQQQALDAALATLAKVGLTSVQDAGVDLATWQLYQANQAKLTSRIYVMLDASPQTWAAAGGPQAWQFDDKLAARAVKLYADGALGSRGAALTEDYSDRPGHKGLMIFAPGELEKRMRAAAEAGFQVNVHAIGDAGNHRVLEAFASFPKALRDGRRNRIEHAQVLQPADIPRLAKLGIIASFQPTHATSDMNMAEKRLGKTRMEGAYAWRRLLDAKVKLAAGSDFPVESPNPFFGLYSAVTRQDHEGQPEKGWYGDQALTREEALYLFTQGAAYAGFMEGFTGSLAKGQWADLLILDQDYFEIPAQAIWQMQPRETWLAGQAVYVRKDK